jgi:hypothetical protein
MFQVGEKVRTKVDETKSIDDSEGKTEEVRVRTWKTFNVADTNYKDGRWTYRLSDINTNELYEKGRWVREEAIKWSG